MVIIFVVPVTGAVPVGQLLTPAYGLIEVYVGNLLQTHAVTKGWLHFHNSIL